MHDIMKSYSVVSEIRKSLGRVVGGLTADEVKKVDILIKEQGGILVPNNGLKKDDYKALSVAKTLEEAVKLDDDVNAARETLFAKGMLVGQMAMGMDTGFSAKGQEVTTPEYDKVTAKEPVAKIEKIRSMSGYKKKYIEGVIDDEVAWDQTPVLDSILSTIDNKDAIYEDVMSDVDALLGSKSKNKLAKSIKLYMENVKANAAAETDSEVDAAPEIVFPDTDADKVVGDWANMYEGTVYSDIQNGGKVSADTKLVVTDAENDKLINRVITAGGSVIALNQGLVDLLDSNKFLVKDVVKLGKDETEYNTYRKMSIAEAKAEIAKLKEKCR